MGADARSRILSLRKIYYSEANYSHPCLHDKDRSYGSMDAEECSDRKPWVWLVWLYRVLAFTTIATIPIQMSKL